MHGDSMEQELINQLLALPGETVHLEKGEFLFHEGDIADHFLLSVKGDLVLRNLRQVVIFLLIGWWGQIMCLVKFLCTRRTPGLTCSMRLHVKNARYIPSVMMF